MMYFSRVLFFVIICLSGGLAYGAVADDARFFANPMMTQLRPGVRAMDLEKMGNASLREVAKGMLAGKVKIAERCFRVTAYETVQALSERLKTSGYSQFENATGVYFSAGEKAVLCVKNLDSRYPMVLRVYEWGREGTGSDVSYPLQEGLNEIEVQKSGLGYLSYYHVDWQKAPMVYVSVMSGRMNGVFDGSRDTNEKWKGMLANAVCDVVDIVGKKVSLVYSVEDLRKSCPDQGRELIALYDRMMYYEHEVMGLVKYQREPKNHILGRSIWKGFMHADGWGAAFINTAMGEVGSVEAIPRNSWGIAHEFGHVNQVRPGMKWVSTSEVTNNIYSAYCNYRLCPGEMRLEHEDIDGLVGGRFNAYLNGALVKKQHWLCQDGPDNMQKSATVVQYDHFVKLGPLWQLQLYFGIAKLGNQDFYPDVFEKVRNTDCSKMSNGELQLQFMRNACDAAKMDLTDFFLRTGMLQPIDRELDDYRNGQMTITQGECDDLVRYVRGKRYPKPLSPVIYYLSANSVEAFAKRAAVEGRANSGLKREGKYVVVSHAVWKNVAAFETYKGNEVTRVTMVGTGSKENRSTHVLYEEGSTKILAVSWDGKRTLVCGG